VVYNSGEAILSFCKRFVSLYDAIHIEIQKFTKRLRSALLMFPVNIKCRLSPPRSVIARSRT